MRLFHQTPAQVFIRAGFKVDVFTRFSGLGNRSAVVSGFKGSEKDMAHLAKKINFPATTFILPPIKSDSVALLRFFTPTMEIPMCGHGALASAVYLFEKMPVFIPGSLSPTVVVDTVNAQLSLFKQANGLTQIRFSKAKELPFCPDTDTICRMLGISQNDVNLSLPYGVASVGVPLMFIAVESKKQLATLQPNRSAILDWTVKNQLGGIYVYTTEVRNPPAILQARCFNPRFNNNFEDVATGAAAAALASLWYASHQEQTEIVIEQGHFLGKECLIYLSVNPENKSVKMGGYLSSAKLDLEAYENENNTISSELK